MSLYGSVRQLTLLKNKLLELLEPSLKVLEKPLIIFGILGA